MQRSTPLDISYGAKGSRSGEELLQVRTRLCVLTVFALGRDQHQPWNFCVRSALGRPFRNRQLCLRNGLEKPVVCQKCIRETLAKNEVGFRGKLWSL